MRVVKRTLYFLEDDWQMLMRISTDDMRVEQAQLAWLIRQEAARRGLLELDATQERSDEAVDVEEQQRTTK